MQNPIPFLIASLVLATGCAQPPPPSAPHVLLNKSAAFVLPSSEGALTDVPLKSARATVVDFWATDCKPCQKSLPALARKASVMKEDGVELVLVAVLRDDESTDTAKAKLESWGVRRPFLVDRGGAIQKQLNVMNLPATLVLDRAGTLQWMAPSEASVEEIVAAARHTGRSSSSGR